MENYRFIKLYEMELTTQNILKEYGFDLDRQMDFVPIPIEEIIEFHYGIEIQWDNIDHFDPSGEVMAAIIPSKKQIIMNDSKKDLYKEKIGTINFTMAHELGHWVLHASDEKQLTFKFKGQDAFYCRNKTKKPPEEFQADMFAGALLMPESVIKLITQLSHQNYSSKPLV